MKKSPVSLPTVLIATLLTLIVQSFSLFRDFPTSPVCGRVVNIFAELSVLINCDSAVFMKDAQDPSRVFEGISVYQDRPAHSVLAWILAMTMKLFGLPNQSRQIVGTSGQTTIYETLYYGSYILINLIVVVISVLLALKFVFGTLNWKSIKFQKYFALVILLIVAANELSKTFFWTPHSQMFNILLPTLSLALLANRSKTINFPQFITLNATTLLLMFLYPLFGLLFGLLLFTRYASFIQRLITISLFSSVYVFYPQILEFLGGKHRNFVVEEYRQYVWVFDSIRENELITNLALNLKSFGSTFPILPTIGLIIVFIVLTMITARSQSIAKEKVWTDLLPYLLFAFIYLVALSLMGYYSRRLTLGLYIFLELLAIKFSLKVLDGRFNKAGQIFLTLILALLVGSWIWTNGPLE
jgi:hypothetical protein